MQEFCFKCTQFDNDDIKQSSNNLVISDVVASFAKSALVEHVKDISIITMQKVFGLINTAELLALGSGYICSSSASCISQFLVRFTRHYTRDIVFRARSSIKA